MGGIYLGQLEIVHMYLFGGVKFLHFSLILMALDIITGIFKAYKNEKSLESKESVRLCAKNASSRHGDHGKYYWPNIRHRTSILPLRTRSHTSRSSRHMDAKQQSTSYKLAGGLTAISQAKRLCLFRASD